MQVPALPPPVIPAFVDDPKLFVPIAGSRRGSTVHASVLVITFEETTSRLARARIVGLVDGIVVGGAPAHRGGDGPYYVQVARDTTGRRIMDLGNIISRLPGVAAAFAIVAIPHRARQSGHRESQAHPVAIPATPR